MVKTKADKASSIPKKAQIEETSGSELNILGLLKKLADNRRPVREQALAVVAQYISSKKTLSLEKLQKLWKGMFYTMWHSDRPLTQQRLASDLAQLLTKVDAKNFWVFVSAFWIIMVREWHTIDSHRINKFYLLVRFFLAGILDRVKSEDWSEEWLAEFHTSMVTYGWEPSSLKIPHALRLHMASIYLDEIEKVKGEDEIEYVPLNELMQPVLDFMEKTDFKVCKKATRENVMEDPRLVEWGFVEAPVVEKSLESDDDDWEGFD